jgi:formamidopyrimidine-DNA glycosylase
MPELPEVEQVARELREILVGRRVDALRHAHADVLRYGEGLGPTSFAGRKVDGVDRRGKLLLFDLGDALVLTVHLRMTGRLFVERSTVERPQHCHLVWALDGGEELRFSDARRFGRAQLLRRAELEDDSFLRRLGPEPFDIELADMRQRLLRRRGTLKGALLDQSLVAGLGNIYVDEILHQARLHPLLVAATLREDETKRLREAMRRVMEAAIAAGGSTIRNYRRPSGEFGGFQESHEVFGRAGEACRSCGDPVVKIVVVGRGTFLCPACQPKRRRKLPSAVRAKTRAGRRA